MSYEVLLAPEAMRDLREIYRYIALDLQSAQNAAAQLDRLENLIRSVQDTIDAMERKEPMEDERKFAALKRQTVAWQEATYGQEARSRWGDQAVDRAQGALVRELDRAYICRSGDTHYRIPIANILYFVSDRRQVTCVTEGRGYTFYGKLDAVAEEVGAGFVRVHQRYLVRAGAVDRMEGGEVVLRDGQHLPVSRSCQQSALLALTRAELEG